ncbi:sister chromatid cohesion protein Dcc1p [[Candida] jaroonii]|uniref:Sister chromatid cohesion protein Dcc1p n=1 Tax=[Candida] jaroonii TaxID=467808 RepID=A0ACA9Y5D1_9ASCO|nr:sister chromatid cohesion protein Dcc1p [[Candida] jaroonii]
MELPVYQHLRPNVTTYKLLQLPPDVLEAMNLQDPIQIKSSRNEADLVMVSPDKTWRLRQMNQTNSVLLMDETTRPGSLIGKANLPYQYEVVAIDGSINTADIPIFTGQLPYGELYSVEDLLNDSAISKNQFFKHWFNIGGCEIEGRACILSPDFIKEVVDLFLTLVITKQIDYKSEEFNIEETTISSELKGVDSRVTDNIVTTVLHKFCDFDPKTSKFRVNNEKVAMFYGILALKSLQKPIDTKEFYLVWKNYLPNFYNIPINLDLLKGWYYKNSGLHYLDGGELSMDIGTRIKELFACTGQWELEDMEPYLKMFVVNKKVESLLLKYAKVKRVGSKKIVVPR